MQDQFQSMFQKRAFIHWYTGEGMDEQEFCDAENGVQCLINEYNDCNVQDDEPCDDDCESEEAEDESGCEETCWRLSN